MKMMAQKISHALQVWAIAAITAATITSMMAKKMTASTASLGRYTASAVPTITSMMAKKMTASTANLGRYSSQCSTNYHQYDG